MEDARLPDLQAQGRVLVPFLGCACHRRQCGLHGQSPQFRDAFVSARTRNTTTPGLDSEKVLGVDLSYNLNLPWITARVSGYYTSVADQSKVISYYDDTQSSFTNFAMSGIDKRYYGLEVGVVVPIWGGISFNGALSLGDYRYTSDANSTQTRDNSEEVLRRRQGALGRPLRRKHAPDGAQPRPELPRPAQLVRLGRFQLLRPYLPLDEPSRAVPVPLMPRYCAPTRRHSSPAP
ncbi:MAG: TonB-dependent receptor domain-containing protein [Alistipes onderdonkii]